MIIPYQTNHKIPILRLLIFCVILFIAAFIAGFIVYFINSMIYLMFISPLLIGVLFSIPIQKWIKFNKIHSPIFVVPFCFIAGAIMVFTLYAIPYWNEKNQFINDVQKTYQLTTSEANIAFHDILFEESGSDGLWGYMKLMAREGSTYENYFVVNQTPIKISDFSLTGFGLWLFWIVESLLLILPILWASYKQPSEPYNIHSDQWYDSHPKQIADIYIESKDQLINTFISAQLSGIFPLLHEETTISHPKLELIEMHNLKDSKEVLLTIIETRFNDKQVIKRKALSRWEVSQTDFQVLFQQIPIPNN
jgi:hypothetical protein